MYSLFLVDDEIELIEGLKDLIDWTSYDINICGEADNGMTALEEILIKKPDIILMDIKMPKMNGLELLEELCSKGIKSKCIILSGYDDFSFAKKAISLSACNYLLKPCRPSEILDAVLEAKNKLIEDRSKDELLKKYEGNMHEYLSIVKGNFLKELILKPYVKSRSMEDNIRLSNFSFSNFLISILTVDHSTLIKDSFNDADLEFIKSSIKGFVVEHLSETCSIEIFENSSDIIILAAFNEEDIIKNIFPSSLEKLKTAIRTSLGFSVTIALGQIVNELKDIHTSYASAKSALEFKFFIGDNNLIRADQVNKLTSNFKPYPMNCELKIINHLRTGQVENIREAIEEFYAYFYDGVIPTKKNIQGATLSLLGSINKFCIENDIDINSLSKLGSPFDVILQCQTIDELKKLLELIISNIFMKINEMDKSNSLIKLAINFIIENYSRDITLDSIAREIHLTPGYISQLFKQETGVNFLEFLHKYRIEKSKELLKNKLLKNYEIASMVGYTNEKHFSKTFKKYTGLTPSQYKASIMT